MTEMTKPEGQIPKENPNVETRTNNENNPMTDKPEQTCPAPIVRLMPWKPFAPQPLKDPAAELHRAKDVPALRAAMEFLETEIAQAASIVASARGESLAKAAGRFEGLLDFHELISRHVADKAKGGD